MGRHTGPTAVNTIVVTTRAAVNSLRRTGNMSEARASVDRGLALLELLDRDIGPERPEMAGMMAAARAELQSLAASALSPMGPGIPGADEPPPPRTGPRSRGAPREAH